MRRRPHSINGAVINGFVTDELQRIERPTMSHLKPPFKIRHTLQKTTRRAIKRLPTVTLIMRLLIAALRL